MKVIVGAAHGYDWNDIAPFVLSLERLQYGGRVVLFADGEGAEKAREHGAETLPCPPIKSRPHADRFDWILDLLRGLIPAESSGSVFCTDVRDTIFQPGIEYFPSEGLHVFEEDRSMTLGSCPYNSKWLRIGYGEANLAELAPLPICCVGSICGGLKDVALYLQKLTIEIHRLQPKTPEFQDQSCHNYLVYESPGVHPRIWQNEDSPVYTVGYVSRGEVRIANDLIVNQAGRVPAVVHQWDRHENLKQLVRDSYVV